MKQSADYTFKYNKTLGRHGWLRLTPAYSVKLVQELLKTDTLFQESPATRILDPFCGTTTTGIVASENGFDCDLYDINPFLVWFGKIKSSNFDKKELIELKNKVSSDLRNVVYSDNKFWIPPMKNIERWWNDTTLSSLSCLHRYIDRNWGKPSEAGAHNLLWIAFSRLCIESSAADFNHISVSFKAETQNIEWSYLISLFLDILENILTSASIPLQGQVNIYLGDSRHLEYEGKYDMVITSPPYPNRISYIRELRPYMYWLDFLQTGEQAGELDWKAIGGTWGCATSKLTTWEPSHTENLPSNLFEVCSKIKSADNKNGNTMSQYVLKFFDDMYEHLCNLRNHLNMGARLFYILGNSSFYGNFVETDVYIKHLMLNLGYEDVNIDVIRKRNSKTGLLEFNISAVWP